MSESHSGGCHCGRLRYRFDAPLRDIAHCHCSICRRTTGGIVTTWITVPLADFHWEQGTVAAYASSATCTRYFCSHCGCNLALFTTQSSETVDVTVATLDEVEQAPADRHIWTDSRVGWLKLDEQLPEERQEAI